MIINHNITALNTHRQLGAATNAQSKSMEKLASGMRINRAGDDAAGLAISEKMRGQIRGLDQASRNAQDGISMIQTAEGALNETHDILQRMRELATQSANDTNTDADRGELQKEVNQLSEEISRIAENTEFNTKNLIDGTATNVTFQIGANENQNIKISINDMSATALKVENNLKAATNGGDKVLVDGAGNEKATWADAVPADPGNGVAAKAAGYYDADDKLVLASATALDDDAVGVKQGINISDQASADSAITVINTAIETVSQERSKLGAHQNRLEHTINNLGTSSENLTAAESRIRDTDMAKTMMDQTKNSILSQAAQAMLAQANSAPQGVLQLLR
ncbi:flagellin N-terminal helical domain-containing protein [Peribacillus sp. FSL M8-0224]|jgi:flagellin|uniref:flagellin N-terminal helical domain-containing protein n=1 Tax=Peribacillus sp. FSL M8-0224 TaxID=2921568 RepID=UPI0030F59331|nr:flagellin [Brevibacterium sp. PAMC21349]